jgi:uncharacterized protein (DUF488 family)
VAGIDYLHLPELAPTKELLDAFRKTGESWSVYEKDFLQLIARRQIETKIDKALMHLGCLLCSEEKPDHCHRRLVAEYLRDKWGDMEIVHIE